MKTLTAMMATLLIANAAQALEIGGIDMPDNLDAPRTEKLHLNGAGIREKFFIDLYVGGLYLQHKESDAAVILAAEEPMAIRLHIVSDLITSEKMISATEEGFEKSTHGNVAPIKDRIERLLSSFQQPIKSGDIFDFVYTPDKGLNIIKNGTLTDTISGDDNFKAAFFGIWISDKPAQKSLRKEMLGMNS